MNNERIITKELLDRVLQEHFDKEKFLEVDPCGLVYELMRHTGQQLDIELGALFVAMITWGNRKAIRKAARKMLEQEMKWHPAEFVLEQKYLESYLDAKNGCVYRTLNRNTFTLVCHNIREALLAENTNREELTLENIFNGMNITDIIAMISGWLSPARLGQPGKSACKRICMYLRWMVRREAPDLGLWKRMKQADLYAIMDTHVCQLAAPLLSRRQADWKTCTELTNIFRSWSPEDPLKYDLALMTAADHGL
jgi:uncharacterized protein (TIGR02757 family)